MSASVPANAAARQGASAPCSAPAEKSALAGGAASAAEKPAPRLRPSGAPVSEPVKLGVLISGSGTNLQAIIDRIADGSLHATVEMVIASNGKAKGLKRAADAGIQTLALSPEVYAVDPDAADEIIAHEFLSCGVEYVVMAGYMRKVGEALLALFPNRIINIHPALLPSFQGAHGIQDAWCRGVKVTGVTVHFANAVYDQGPIIAQEPVRIEEGMGLDELESAIHTVEHELYPRVLQQVSEGKVHVKGDGTVAIG